MQKWTVLLGVVRTHCPRQLRDFCTLAAVARASSWGVHVLMGAEASAIGALTASFLLPLSTVSDLCVSFTGATKASCT